jgi:hypothetical protein
MHVPPHRHDPLMTLFGPMDRISCPYRKSNPHVVMVQSTKDGAHLYTAGVLNDPSNRRILA